MKAGQTVAATIPAAVIAIALFRLPYFRGVLEQNIARTAASVGEALVAGAIFTIPAFMMVEIGGEHLWTDLRAHYWQAALDSAGGRADRRLLHHPAAPAAVRGKRPALSGKRGQRGDRQGRRSRAATRPSTFSAPWASPALLQILKIRQGPADLPRVHRGLSGVSRVGGAPFRFRKDSRSATWSHTRRRLLVHAQPLARADRHRLHHRAGAFGHQRLRRRSWPGGF